MSLFTRLPQDALQYEINRYLDPKSRAEFNAVLKPDERIYKKFPADYALKHNILILHTEYKLHLNRIQLWIDTVAEEEPGKERACARACAKRISEFINWLKEPRHAMLIKYKAGMKKRFLNLLDHWMGMGEDKGGNVWLYDCLNDYRVTHLQLAATEAYSIVKRIEFIRDVDLKGFQE